MKPNIILIVCDTLRKDMLGVYGGEAKTPNLKEFAKDAMVYDNCIAPSPWTFPSHVSLFTGLYPSQHGVHETEKIKTEQLIEPNKKLKAERLAEYLKKQGYNTIGVSNNIMISRFTGFDIGFDQFTSFETNPWFQSKMVKEAFELEPSVVKLAFRLIKERKFNDILKYTREYNRVKSLAKATNFPVDKGAKFVNEYMINSKLPEPLFLFINLFDVHEPYVGQKLTEISDNYTGVRKISDKKVAFLRKQYINEIEYIDQQIGQMIETLKVRGLYDNSLIIFTSDHGQAFNEHGFMYHSVYLYDEIVRVPLIIRYPNGKKFKKRKGYQSLINLFDLIKLVLEDGDDKVLTSEFAVSEAFGHVNWLPKSYMNRMQYVKEHYEKVRRAVYSNNFKLTFNYTDNMVEEFLKNGRKIDVQNYRSKVRSLLTKLH